MPCRLFFASKRFLLPVLALATAFGALPALAYGPEGLFGGRPNPDNTVILENTMQVEVEPPRGETVLQHPRPDYDPVPLVVGGFDVFPLLETGASYDSNIYATDTHAQGDGIVTLHPAVTAESNWSRHALSLTTFGDINYYGSHDQENFTDEVTELQGRYDIAPETWLSAHGDYQYLEEPRTSPNNLGGSEPTTFNVYSTGLRAYRGVGILQTELDYDLRRFDYNNPSAAVGIINESFRDRVEQKVGGKASYVVTEDFKPYIKAQYDDRAYDEDPARQSQGFETAVGAVWDAGGITSVDAYIGWLAQNYAKFTGNRVNGGVDFGGRLLWNVTGLTTLALETNRSIEETALASFDSYMATGGSATLTHELRRNLLIEGDASFTRDDFQGVGSRQDDVAALGAGTRWLINRQFYSDLDYNWSHRVSSAAGESYVDHLVTARLGAQF